MAFSVSSPSFSFGASSNPGIPDRPKPPVAPPVSAPPTPSGDDPLAPLFAALARAMLAQQANAGSRLQLQRDQTFGQHLGTGGAPVTPENPLGYTGGSPFDNGFFTSGARDLTPEQLMASQGATAINQWKRPDLFGGSRPDGQTTAEAAMGASPAPFQLDPSTLALMGRGGPQPPSALAKRRGRDFSFSAGGSPRPTRFGAGAR